MVKSISSSSDTSSRYVMRRAASSDDALHRQTFAESNADASIPPPASTSERPHRGTDRSQGRQHFGASHGCSQIVRNLLDKVRRDINALPEDIYTNDSDAAPNASGLRCVEASMVHVHLGPGSDTKRHAAHINEIDFSRDANQHQHTAKFRAGQSPAAAVTEVGTGTGATAATAAEAGLSQACEKALVEGIESGMGVYQFVSRKAHAHPAESKESPILHILQQRLASQRSGDPDLLLGGRYRVIRFDVQHPEAHDHRHVLLSVQDTLLGVDHANSIQTIPLTQAGMKFTGKLLDTPEIAGASAALDAHRKLIPNEILRAARQAEPTIYSHAGIGRNATLITYRRIAKLIRQNPIPNETVLAEVLRQTIKTEREFCGKKFLHSEAQINALWLALSANLAEHKAKQPVDGLPRDSVGVAATHENLSTSASVGPDTTVPLSTAVESAATAIPIAMVKSGNESAATAIPNTMANSGNASTATVISSASVKSSNASSRTAIPTPTINLNNDATPARIPRVRKTSQAIATDLFEELEYPDNHHYANWRTGAVLIYQNDPAKFQHFVWAFDAQRYGEPDLKPGDPEPKGFLKHLSDSQLAAIKKHINDPANADSKPRPKPVSKEEQDKNDKAIKALQNGDDFDCARLTPAVFAASLAFQLGNFAVLPNVGSGDCLFNALCGTPDHRELSKELVAEIRCQAALVRLGKPDTELDMRSNWHALHGALPNARLLEKAFEENGIPQELSNAQVAFIEQRTGYIAGDLEIADWLAIPGNKTEVVIVIDRQPNAESIVKFSRQPGQPVDRLPWPVKSLEGFDTVSAENIDAWVDHIGKWIEHELTPALNDPQAILANETPRVVAIYRNVGHFERIVGFGKRRYEPSPSVVDHAEAGLL